MLLTGRTSPPLPRTGKKAYNGPPMSYSGQSLCRTCPCMASEHHRNGEDQSSVASRKSANSSSCQAMPKLGHLR